VGSGEQTTGFFIPLTAGILVFLAVLALVVFELPIAANPRYMKATDQPENTTFWDKWLWEREHRAGSP
jgi:hypothetical protein